MERPPAAFHCREGGNKRAGAAESLFFKCIDCCLQIGKDLQFFLHKSGLGKNCVPVLVIVNLLLTLASHLTIYE